MKIVKILSVIGIIMILFGLGYECEQLNKKIIEQNNIIESQRTLIDEVGEKYIRLEEENMVCWNMYYSGVSEYSGEYEYYE